MDAQREQSGTSALLVVDLQRGLFKRPTPVFEEDALLRNVSTLAEAAHATDSLVVYLRHSNKILVPETEPWQLHPSIQKHESDLMVEKTHGDAFEDTELDALMKARSVHTVYVTGLVSEGCVRATCLGALKREYRVVLVSDAHSSFHRDAAKRVRDWNEKLSAELDAVTPTSEIHFDSQPAS